MRTKIDVVLPCYNAGEHWPSQLQEFYSEAKDLFDLHFILVNDGSLGGNVEKHVQSLRSKDISIQLISYPVNHGKGHALRQGVATSRADYMVYTDVDFPFTSRSVVGVIEELLKNSADIVAGFRSENYYENKMSWFRKALSKSFRFFIKKILRLPVSDTQCGLKGFNKKGKEIFLGTRTNRYLFDFEFIYTACRHQHITVQAKEVVLKENVVFRKMRTGILAREFFNLLVILLLSGGKKNDHR